MCVADETQISRGVLAYLAEHQDAADTLEGILEWWLLEQRIRQQLSTVRCAMDDLVRHRLVLAQKGQDGRVRYRLNRRKMKEIAALLKKT